jgi:hypothetical protein
MSVNCAADDDGTEAVAVIRRFCLRHHFIQPLPPHQPDKALATSRNVYKGDGDFIFVRPGIYSRTAMMSKL